MNIEIKFHDPVTTSDGHKLGLAQRIYIKPEDTELDNEIYPSHLKVFDFEVGDDLYIPTAFIDSREENDGVKLSLTLEQVQEQTLSREPRYIAYDVATKQELEK